MKIHEMLYDAAKYPFSGVKQLLILGLMILISSLLLGDYSNFYNYLDSIFGDTALMLVLMLVLLLFTILSILEAGYSFKIIEKSVLRIEEPPKLNNFIHMFKHGLNEIIIGLIYFSIPFILSLIILDALFSEISLGMPVISDEFVFILIFVIIFLGFISDIIFTVAVPHMAFKGGAFKEAFNFPEIFKKIRRIGFKKLLVGYFIVILGIVVIGGPILKEVIESTNIVGFFVAEEILAPYLVMFYARFISLVYNS
ncbi:MAG: DUF4013 domain-containing protein [Methanobacterium sp.]